MNGSVKALVPQAAWEGITTELVRQEVRRFTVAEDQLVAAIEQASLNGVEDLQSHEDLARSLVEGERFRYWSRVLVDSQRRLEELDVAQPLAS